MTDKKVVDTAVAKEFADSMGISFIETSAKQSTNVQEAFLTMAAQIKERLGGSGANDGGSNEKAGVNLRGGQSVSQSNSGCC